MSPSEFKALLSKTTPRPWATDVLWTIVSPETQQIIVEGWFNNQADADATIAVLNRAEALCELWAFVERTANYNNFVASSDYGEACAILAKLREAPG